MISRESNVSMKGELFHIARCRLLSKRLYSLLNRWEAEASQEIENPPSKFAEFSLPTISSCVPSSTLDSFCSDGGGAGEAIAVARRLPQAVERRERRAAPGRPALGDQVLQRGRPRFAAQGLRRRRGAIPRPPPQNRTEIAAGSQAISRMRDLESLHLQRRPPNSNGASHASVPTATFY